MSIDLILKPSCDGCRSTVELYGSMCKHLTLCVKCGKTMAENRAKCYGCGNPITRLIRWEYNVRACSSSDKNYYIARFASGLPSFKKKNENKWSLQKEGLQERQVTDTLRDKYKNRPWLLEDETGKFQYHGSLEGAQSATYYLLMLRGKEFVAIPAGSWYNFNKVAQYKQLTLEEAEEKMKNRRKTADGYQRWMMKAANNGAAAFGELEKLDDRVNAAGGGRGRKKSTGDGDEANVSDKGDEDEEEAARKSRLRLNKKGWDDDEEGPRGGDLDFDDDDIGKGDDWEHEEIFTDDDEAVGIDPEERDDLAPEFPTPPEIKQDDEDEDEGDEEEGGLSKSGKELKKLLGRVNGLNNPDEDDDDDDVYFSTPVYQCYSWGIKQMIVLLNNLNIQTFWEGYKKSCYPELWMNFLFYDTLTNSYIGTEDDAKNYIFTRFGGFNSLCNGDLQIITTQSGKKRKSCDDAGSDVPSDPIKSKSKAEEDDDVVMIDDDNTENGKKKKEA
ncbi:Transcription initiation factor IIF subunit alpha [Orobanche gracilis]